MYVQASLHWRGDGLHRIPSPHLLPWKQATSAQAVTHLSS